MRLKYIKSKIFKDAYFYECTNCGLDIKPSTAENCIGFNCKCGERFTKLDVLSAKVKYIETIYTYKNHL